MLPAGVALKAFYCDHPGSRNWRSAIVVPARNEQTHIGRCLRAIAGQDAGHLQRTLSVVVANNCSDDTVDEVLAAARSLKLAICLLELSLDESLGVGTARKVGTQAAIDFAPSVAAILTTDADCRVAPDWLARNLEHLERADVVCGRLVPEQSEVDALAPSVRASVNLEARYRDACREFMKLTTQGKPHLAEQLSPANGASLAFRYHALLSAGGFSDELTNEDREVIRRARRAGAKIVHADDVVVAASCRLQGRTPGGMAATLASWDEGRHGLHLELPSVTQLAQAALDPGLERDGCQRLRLAELATQSQRLEALNDLLRQLPEQCRRAYLQFFLGQRVTCQQPLPELSAGENAQPLPVSGGFDRSA